MWATVRRPDGSIGEMELPPDLLVGIGDILQDGSVVLELEAFDETDDDFYATEGYLGEMDE
jgi:hypothetical protein